VDRLGVPLLAPLLTDMPLALHCAMHSLAPAAVTATIGMCGPTIEFIPPANVVDVGVRFASACGVRGAFVMSRLEATGPTLDEVSRSKARICSLAP
jgi:hypothetical protein